MNERIIEKKDLKVMGAIKKVAKRLHFSLKHTELNF